MISIDQIANSDNGYIELIRAGALSSLVDLYRQLRPQGDEDVLVPIQQRILALLERYPNLPARTQKRLKEDPTFATNYEEGRKKLHAYFESRQSAEREFSALESEPPGREEKPRSRPPFLQIVFLSVLFAGLLNPLFIRRMPAQERVDHAPKQITVANHIGQIRDITQDLGGQITRLGEQQIFVVFQNRSQIDPDKTTIRINFVPGLAGGTLNYRMAYENSDPSWRHLIFAELPEKERNIPISPSQDHVDVRFKKLGVDPKNLTRVREDEVDFHFPTVELPSGKLGFIPGTVLSVQLLDSGVEPKDLMPAEETSELKFMGRGKPIGPLDLHDADTLQVVYPPRKGEIALHREQVFVQFSYDYRDSAHHYMGGPEVVATQIPDLGTIEVPISASSFETQHLSHAFFTLDGGTELPKKVVIVKHPSARPPATPVAILLWFFTWIVGAPMVFAMAISPNVQKLADRMRTANSLENLIKDFKNVQDPIKLKELVAKLEPLQKALTNELDEKLTPLLKSALAAWLAAEERIAPPRPAVKTQPPPTKATPSPTSAANVPPTPTSAAAPSQPTPVTAKSSPITPAYAPSAQQPRSPAQEKQLDITSSERAAPALIDSKFVKNRIIEALDEMGQNEGLLRLKQFTNMETAVIWEFLKKGRTLPQAQLNVLLTATNQILGEPAKKETSATAPAEEESATPSATQLPKQPVEKLTQPSSPVSEKHAPPEQLPELEEIYVGHKYPGRNLLNRALWECYGNMAWTLRYVNAKLMQESKPLVSMASLKGWLRNDEALQETRRKARERPLPAVIPKPEPGSLLESASRGGSKRPDDKELWRLLEEYQANTRAAGKLLGVDPVSVLHWWNEDPAKVARAAELRKERPRLPVTERKRSSTSQDLTSGRFTAKEGTGVEAALQRIATNDQLFQLASTGFFKPKDYGKVETNLSQNTLRDNLLGLVEEGYFELKETRGAKLYKWTEKGLRAAAEARAVSKADRPTELASAPIAELPSSANRSADAAQGNILRRLVKVENAVDSLVETVGGLITGPQATQSDSGAAAPIPTKTTELSQALQPAEEIATSPEAPKASASTKVVFEGKPPANQDATPKSDPWREFLIELKAALESSSSILVLEKYEYLLGKKNAEGFGWGNPDFWRLMEKLKDVRTHGHLPSFLSGAKTFINDLIEHLNKKGVERAAPEGTSGGPSGSNTEKRYWKILLRRGKFGGPTDASSYDPMWGSHGGGHYEKGFHIADTPDRFSVGPEQAKSLLARLTPGQFATARLVAQSLKNKEIAERLGIGEQTVKNRIHEIYLALCLRRDRDLRIQLASLVRTTMSDFERIIPAAAVSPLAQLTPREIEVALVVAGFGIAHDNELAAILSRSVFTIRHHLNSIYRKLGLRKVAMQRILLARQILTAWHSDPGSVSSYEAFDLAQQIVDERQRQAKTEPETASQRRRLLWNAQLRTVIGSVRVRLGLSQPATLETSSTRAVRSAA